MPSPAFIASCGSLGRTRASRRPRPRRRTRPSPKSAPRRSLRPAPTSPARPTTSPARTLRLTSCTRPGTLSPRTRRTASSTSWRRWSSSSSLQLAPDHQVRPAERSSNSPIGPLPTTAPSRSTVTSVGEREDLVQPVRDEHRRHAALLQRPHRVEERLDLVVGERARRLVEDEHARVRGQRPRDLDQLLEVGPQPPRRGAEVDATVEARRAAPRRPAAWLRQSIPRQVRGLRGPRKMFSATESSSTSARLLGDRRDACRQRLARGRGTRPASRRAEPALVGRNLRRHDLRATSTCRSRSRRRGRAPRPRAARAFAPARALDAAVALVETLGAQARGRLPAVTREARPAGRPCRPPEAADRSSRASPA